MNSKPTVVEMLREAVTAIGGDVITNSEIRHYIESKYGKDINHGTIR